MIRADQLQIGDYVLVSGTPRRVESITKKKIGYHINPQTDNRLYYARLHDVEPIEITEKFLLKNGFVRGVDVSGVHKVYVYHGDKDEFGMSQNIVRVNLYKELGVLVRTERTCRDSKIGLHVKSAHRPDSQFVHQLQQVCRLCGIEIDWKL